jgi:GT2 family glycosyltransferase
VSIDIAVVNYHTPDDLAAFLASVNRHPPTVEATLTVVDVETDQAEPAMFDWAGGEARRFTANTNIGYARACNLAVENGTGEVVALFNADVELTADALDDCHNALIDNDWGVLGPRQVDHRSRIRHAGIFGTNDKPVHRGWNEFDNDQYRDVKEAVTVAGSAYFIKRRVWDELTDCPLYRSCAPDATGAFLPTSHYYEETFASYHSRAHGHRVTYYGPVTIIHKWHRASAVGGWAEQQMPVSRVLFRQACAAHGIPCD